MARFAAISTKAGSGSAWPAVAGAAVAIAAAPIVAIAPIIFRRVRDVFVGGVLCTRSALAIGFDSSWSGLEPGRKFIASPRLASVVSQFYGKANCDRKETPGSSSNGER